MELETQDQPPAITREPTIESINEEVNPSQLPPKEGMLEEKPTTTTFPSEEDLDREFIFGSVTSKTNNQPPEYELIDGPTSARKFIEFYKRRLQSVDEEDEERRKFGTHFGWDDDKKRFTTASASHWSIEALCAFHVVPFPNLRPEQVIPGYNEEEILADGHFLSMLVQLTQARAEDIGWDVSAYHPGASVKALQALIESESRLSAILGDPDPKPEDGDFLTVFPMTTFIGNPFLSVFTGLRDIRSRRLAEEHVGQIDPSVPGQHTAEKDELKHEASSEELLHRLMEILLVFYELKESKHWLKSTGKRVELFFNVDSDNGPLSCTSRDDGYLYLGRAGQFTNSHRFSNLPVVRYEAKTLSAMTRKQDVPELANKEAQSEDSAGSKPLTVHYDAEVVRKWLQELVEEWEGVMKSHIEKRPESLKIGPGGETLLALKEMDLIGELIGKLPPLVRTSRGRGQWVTQVRSFCKGSSRPLHMSWIYYAADKLLVDMEATRWLHRLPGSGLQVRDQKLKEGTPFQPRQSKNNTPYCQPKKTAADGNNVTSKLAGKTPKISCVDHEVTAQQFSEMLGCIMANIDYRRKIAAAESDKPDASTRTTPATAIKDSKREEKEAEIQRLMHEKDFQFKATLDKRNAGAELEEFVMTQKKLHIDGLEHHNQSGGTKDPTDEIERAATNYDVLCLANAQGGDDSSDISYEEPPPSTDPNETLSRLHQSDPESTHGPRTIQELLMPAPAPTSEAEIFQKSINVPPSPHPDQEAFSIRIAHTYLSIARLYTPGTYLDNVIGKHLYEGEDPVYFQRTREFNLLTRKGRGEAAMALWGLLNHLCNEKVLIERLRQQTGTGRGATVAAGMGTKDTRTDGKPRGMVNGGMNFCYANSVIQCLAATTELLEGLTGMLQYRTSNSRDARRNLPHPGVLELIRAVQAVKLPGGGPVGPAPLLNLFRKRVEHGRIAYAGFTYGRQNDAGEFLITVLDLFMATLGTHKMNGFLTETSTITKCNGVDGVECSQESAKHESPTLITLPLGDPTDPKAKTALRINELLNDYTAPESFEFEGFSPWKGELTQEARDKYGANVPSHLLEHASGNRTPNERCRSKMATKRTEIRSLPNILVLQLGRTAWINGRDSKDARPVEFGLQLEMQTNQSVVVSENSACKYQLYAVIHHIGATMTSGHYIAYVASPDGTKWWCCNDSSITNANTKDILARKTAYILFYKKMDDALANNNASEQIVDAQPAAAVERDSIEEDDDTYI